MMGAGGVTNGIGTSVGTSTGVSFSDADDRERNSPSVTL